MKRQVFPSCLDCAPAGLINVDITVSTSKLKETKQFYTEYLKFQVVKETPGFLSFSPGPGRYWNMMFLSIFKCFLFKDTVTFASSSLWKGNRS